MNTILLGKCKSGKLVYTTSQSVDFSTFRDRFDALAITEAAAIYFYREAIYEVAECCESLRNDLIEKIGVSFVDLMDQVGARTSIDIVSYGRRLLVNRLTVSK